MLFQVYYYKHWCKRYANTDVRDMQSLKWWDESTKKIGEFDQTAFL